MLPWSRTACFVVDGGARERVKERKREVTRSHVKHKQWLREREGRAVCQWWGGVFDVLSPKPHPHTLRCCWRRARTRPWSLTASAEWSAPYLLLLLYYSQA